MYVKDNGNWKDTYTYNQKRLKFLEHIKKEKGLKI